VSTSTNDATAESERPPQRTPEEIEAEIERTRENLAGSIDTLQDRLSPASIAKAATDKVTGVFKRKDGSLDPVRTGAAAAVALVLVVYLIRRRRL
jgi:hypothetical protein